MRKKWFVLTLVLLVAVSFVLVGCGEKKKPGDTAKPAVGQQDKEAPAKEAPAKEAPAAPAAEPAPPDAGAAK